MSLFTVPWRPVLDGKLLHPSKALAAAEDLAPPRADDPVWGRTAIASQLADLRRVEVKAVQATLDALWDINSTQEAGGEDPEWARHALAWLVRPPSTSRRGWFPNVSSLLESSLRDLRSCRDRSPSGRGRPSGLSAGVRTSTNLRSSGIDPSSRRQGEACNGSGPKGDN